MDMPLLLKEGMKMKKNKNIQKVENVQYSYTSLQALGMALMANINEGTRKFLPVKMGESIRNVDQRISEQDNAETLTKLVYIEHVVTSLGVKTDDHIRELVLKGGIKDADWVNYDRKILDIIDNDDNKRNEYVWVRIDDILGNAKFDKYLLEDFGFMKRLSIKISSQKIEALESLGEKHIDVQLRYLQEIIVDEMLKGDNFMFLLNLTPRLGKTLITLQYAKRLSEKLNEPVALIIASKSLNSNVSFIEDRKKFGFKMKMATVSLFKDAEQFGDYEEDEKAIFQTDRKIAKEIQDAIKNQTAILVTDEADFGSHTEDAIAKLENIKNNFNLNIVKQIAMSGTGIAKASKIARTI